jgi:hypothetical protein
LLLTQDPELRLRQTKIDQLTHEFSLHKRWRFGIKTERLPAEQAQRFEETVEADLAAMTEELEQLSGKPSAAKGQAGRKPLPPELPAPRSITNRTAPLVPVAARCAASGENVAEKLDDNGSSSTKAIDYTLNRWGGTHPPPERWEGTLVIAAHGYTRRAQSVVVKSCRTPR